MYSLRELADSLCGCVHGDESITVSRIATLKNAKKGHLSFVTNGKYLIDLKNTKASAVLITEKSLNFCLTNAIVLDDPYLALAKVAQLFNKSNKTKVGIHESASIASSALIAKNVSISANVVIGEHVNIAEEAVIEANSVILDHSSIGKKHKLSQMLPFTIMFTLAVSARSMLIQLLVQMASVMLKIRTKNGLKFHKLVV